MTYVHTFAGNPLDRASERRGDSAWLEAQLASSDALALPLWNGRVFVEAREGGPREGGLRLAYLSGDMAEVLAPGPERRLFLGLWKDAPVFAIDLEGGSDPAAGPLLDLGRFEELRAAAAELSAAEAGIAATARAVFEWRRRHRFCSACGQPSEVRDGGWKRQCPACQAEHFPRTDPVVIMLPVQSDRCLLGRQAAWPEGRFSALAGFLEPGESIEAACAREIQEEAGLETRQVRYHSSQPWPWPSSLMIGLIAEVEGEAAPDQTELSEVRWLTRGEARALLAGQLAGLSAPPPLAIAHHLIRAWAEA